MGQENQKDLFAPQELTSAEDVGLLMEGDVVRVRKFGMEVRAVVGSGSADEKKVLLWRGAMGTVYRACVPVRSAFVSNGVLDLETLFGVESYNKMSGTGDAFKNHNEISDELSRLGFKEAGGCY